MKLKKTPQYFSTEPQPASNKVGLNSLGAGEQGTETLFYYSLPRRSRIMNYEL